MKQTKMAQALRLAFRDSATAFKYRMGSGFAGDVNRTHPAEIEPAKMNAAAPPANWGVPVIVDGATNSVRAFGAADGAVTRAFGVVVRPYPIQQSTGGMSSTFNSGTPPTLPPIVDCCRSGLIMVRVPPAQSLAVQKGGAVYVWISASAGEHVQGGFEAVDGGADTCDLDIARYQFNGPGDENGIVELSFNV